MTQRPENEPIPEDWKPEADAILRGLREAGWTVNDIAHRAIVNTRRNPRYLFEEHILTTSVVKAEGIICTCCVVTAEPTGRQATDGYRLHGWRMGEVIETDESPDGPSTGRLMAGMLERIQHQEQERTETDPNGGWNLPHPFASSHRWEGGPAWRDLTA